MVTLVKGQMGFDLRYILFDLYLTYWPGEVLQAALSRIRMQLYEASDGSVRRVQGLEGEMVVEITYPHEHLEKGEFIFQHLNFPYWPRIETLAAGGAS